MNTSLIRRDIDAINASWRRRREALASAPDAQQAEAKVASDAHRKADDLARAQRLRGEWLILTGLNTLAANVLNYSADPETRNAYLFGRTLGKVDNVAELVALIKSYAYLDTVPSAAFKDPV